MHIHCVPAFQDNYLWLVANEQHQSFAVDPGDAMPILRCLQENGLQLAAILLTHHHPDHTGGVDALLAEFPCPVYGPQSQHIPQVTHPVSDGECFELLGANFEVTEVPGHTLDHIVYFSRDVDQNPVLFSGDTLFAGGCGRVFEGTTEQMHHSLSKLAAMPPETAVYCAHEYTLANLAFARAVEPDNDQLLQRIEKAEQLRAQDIPTVPSTLAMELATNPFIRSSESSVAAAAEQRLGHAPGNDAEVFATIRGWKDNF